MAVVSMSNQLSDYVCQAELVQTSYLTDCNMSVTASVLHAATVPQKLRVFDKRFVLLEPLQNTQV